MSFLTCNQGLIRFDYSKPTTTSVLSKVFIFRKNSPNMIPVLIASVVFVLIAFFLFSVRLLFVKGGEFRGTCAGNSSFLKKDGIACGVCGRKPGEACGKEN